MRKINLPQPPNKTNLGDLGRTPGWFLFRNTIVSIDPKTRNRTVNTIPVVEYVYFL